MKYKNYTKATELVKKINNLEELREDMRQDCCIITNIKSGRRLLSVPVYEFEDSEYTEIAAVYYHSIINKIESQIQEAINELSKL